MTERLFIQSVKIDPSTLVSDIVNHDYRSVDIFRKYEIDYCCGGKWPLSIACDSKGLDINEVMEELAKIMQQSPTLAAVEFDDWDIDFLTDYILNVHHRYLRKALPSTYEFVNHFLADHKKEFPELVELETIFKRMMKDVPPHMQQEEEIIFPYIKQIYHAYRNRESYASLLIRTLRKPVEEMMLKEHEITSKRLHHMRELTNYYTPPEKACIKHKVLFAKLKELDIDLVQHLHLENDFLFPKALDMEKELLEEK